MIEIRLNESGAMKYRASVHVRNDLGALDGSTTEAHGSLGSVSLRTRRS